MLCLQRYLFDEEMQHQRKSHRDETDPEYLRDGFGKRKLQRYDQFIESR